MKKVISVLFFASASSFGASAQTTCGDADFNVDGWIGSSDLLEFLSFYGSTWQDTSSNIGCGDVAYECHTYSTVVIGDQCWFAENCRYLPEVSPNASTSFEEPVYYVFWIRRP